jgi:hypothetical protein
MSGATPSLTGGRRVRHQVRDGFAVMAFSFAASIGVALLLLLLTRLLQPGS